MVPPRTIASASATKLCPTRDRITRPRPAKHATDARPGTRSRRLIALIPSITCTCRAGRRLLSAMLTAQASAAPVMPMRGIRIRFSTMLTASEMIVLIRFHELCRP
jgi:hypothetical protein